MKPLNEQEKQALTELIQAGKSLPPVWKSRLFDSGDEEFVEATRVYQLIMEGTPASSPLWEED